MCKNHGSYFTETFTSLHSLSLDRCPFLCEIVATREPQETPEYRIFQEHLANLVHAIQDPLYLAIQLYSRGIITFAVKDHMSIALLSTLEKNGALMKSVLELIQVDPQVFYEFLSVLREDPTIKSLVESMHSKCSTLST